MLKYFWYSRKNKKLRFALLGVRKAYQRRALKHYFMWNRLKVRKRWDIPGENVLGPGNNRQVNKAILSNGGNYKDLSFV